MVTMRKKGGSTSCGITTCSLPDELLMDILTRLPAKVVLQCKCICKHWHSLIEDPSFVDLHHTRAKSRPDSSYLVIYLSSYQATKIHFFSADYEGGPAQHLLTHSMKGTYRFRPSVNGLMCGYIMESNSIFIVNPTTRQVVTLPPSGLLTDDAYNTYPQWLSFGFEPSAKQYKVLLICRKQIKVEGECYDYLYYKCEIFTLGAHSWRKIDDASVPSHYEFGMGGCCLNGVIHWRNSSDVIPKPSPPMDADVIVTFDLKSEIFQVIPMPSGSSQMFRLRELRGHLVAFYELAEDDDDWNYWEEFWILQDYDNWIWVKEIMKPPPLDWVLKEGPYISNPILTGEILLQSLDPTHLLTIYCYDRNRKVFRKIKITGLPEAEFFSQSHGDGYFKVTDYVENLFSLNDI